MCSVEYDDAEGGGFYGSSSPFVSERNSPTKQPQQPNIFSSTAVPGSQVRRNHHQLLATPDPKYSQDLTKQQAYFADRLAALTSPNLPMGGGDGDGDGGNFISPTSALFPHTPARLHDHDHAQHHAAVGSPSQSHNHSGYFASIRRTFFGGDGGGHGGGGGQYIPPPPPPPPPPAEVVFKLYDKYVFRDFRPVTFQKLRDLSNIANDKYLEIIQQPTQERLSEGKSGAFFFICGQGEVIVKSIERHEAKTLLSILDDYYTHIATHPNSFLVRFLGLHSIVMYGTEFYFVTMKNIFPAGISLYEKYDIKGSFIARHAKRCIPGKLSTCKHCGQEFIEGYNHVSSGGGATNAFPGLTRLTTGNATGNSNAFRRSSLSRNTMTNESTLPTSSYSYPTGSNNNGTSSFLRRRNNECPVKLGPHESSITLKDNDLMNKLALYPDDVYEIIQTLYADSDFLALLGLMDYSCLIGVQYQEYQLQGLSAASILASTLSWNNNNVNSTTGKQIHSHHNHNQQQQPSHMLNDIVSNSLSTSPLPNNNNNTITTNSPLPHAAITNNILSPSHTNTNTNTTALPTATTTTTITAATAAVPNGTDPFIHNHECKSFPVRSVSAPKEYYLGMIDVLQTWSWEKQCEYWWKVYILGYPADGISCIPPEMYKLRYQAKIAQMFDHEKFVREVTGSWQGKR